MVAGQALPVFWSELGELSIGVQAQAPMQLPPLHPRARSSTVVLLQSAG